MCYFFLQVLPAPPGAVSNAGNHSPQPVPAPPCQGELVRVPEVREQRGASASPQPPRRRRQGKKWTRMASEPVRERVIPVFMCNLSN